MSTEDPFGRLIPAGFTVDELLAIESDLRFAVMMARESGGDVSIPVSREVEWTPEKWAAWNEGLNEIRGQRQGSTD